MPERNDRPPVAVDVRWNTELPMDQVIALYQSVGWSSATKPNELAGALRNADAVVTAWDAERLVGLGYTISDGYIVVNYAHLVVAPKYQRRGIGRLIMRALMSRYRAFHEQVVVADQHSVPFYSSLGFVRAGHTEPMWIYQGDEH